jgi:hypothetical protein
MNIEELIGEVEGSNMGSEGGCNGTNKMDGERIK